MFLFMQFKTCAGIGINRGSNNALFRDLFGFSHFWQMHLMSASFLFRLFVPSDWDFIF